MQLSINEAEKLVTLLNHQIEQLGYDVETEGFGYDEEGNISALSGDDLISFEEGLDFLIDELGIEKEESNG